MRKLLSRFFATIVIAGMALATTGCQMHRAPGALLPSLAAAQQDRSIEQYAAKSKFPSPSDVGLSGADDSADE